MEERQWLETSLPLGETHWLDTSSPVSTRTKEKLTASAAELKRCVDKHKTRVNPAGWVGGGGVNGEEQSRVAHVGDNHQITNMKEALGTQRRVTLVVGRQDDAHDWKTGSQSSSGVGKVFG